MEEINFAGNDPLNPYLHDIKHPSKHEDKPDDTILAGEAVDAVTHPVKGSETPVYRDTVADPVHRVTGEDKDLLAFASFGLGVSQALILWLYIKNLIPAWVDLSYLIPISLLLCVVAIVMGRNALKRSRAKTGSLNIWAFFGVFSTYFALLSLATSSLF